MYCTYSRNYAINFKLSISIVEVKFNFHMYSQIPQATWSTGNLLTRLLMKIINFYSVNTYNDNTYMYKVWN